MTDIVELLKNAAKVAEYQTEIERLRTENKRFREQVAALLEGAQDDEAEIERLREQVTGHSGYEFVSSMADMSDTMTRQRLEIERLRAANAEMLAALIQAAGCLNSVPDRNCRDAAHAAAAIIQKARRALEPKP